MTGDHLASIALAVFMAALLSTSGLLDRDPLPEQLELATDAGGRP